jgi:hypothetical protein
MRPFPPSLLAAVAALALPGAAFAGGCETALAAAKKLETLPYRMHSVSLAAGDAAESAPEVSDMIATKDKLYFEMDGEWQSVPRDMSGMGRIDADLASDGVSCRALPDAELNGVPATAWAVEEKDVPEIVAQTVWIGKDSGLLLRVEQELDQGVGDAGKSRMTIDFSFDDVTPPPGVE